MYRRVCVKRDTLTHTNTKIETKRKKKKQENRIDQKPKSNTIGKAESKRQKKD